MKPFSIGAAIVAAIICVIIILTFGWIDVQPTQVAVEINKFEGKVNPVPLGVGYHFYNRWKTDLVPYIVSSRSFPNDTQKSEEGKQYTLEVKTNDGQNVQVDLTIIYALDAKYVPQLHQQVGANYEDQILLPQIRSEARIVVGSSSAEDLYQGKVRDIIQKSIGDKLRTSLKPYPAIIIYDALLRHFAFSKEFETAIEKKKLASQQVEINRALALAQEQEATRVEAEARGGKLKAVQEAMGRAESAKVDAQGQADAKKIQADAERYRLEQEAVGKLQIFKAEAEGKRLSAEALGGGQNVVALEFAKNIPDKLQIWGIPVGNSSTSLMDVSGIFKGMLGGEERAATVVEKAVRK